MRNQDAGLPPEETWTPVRRVSMIYAVCLTALVGFGAGPLAALEVGLPVGLGLLMVWFPDVMSRADGWTWFLGGRARTDLPERLIQWCGWFLMLLPVLLAVVTLLAIYSTGE